MSYREPARLLTEEDVPKKEPRKPMVWWKKGLLQTLAWFVSLYAVCLFIDLYPDPHPGQISATGLVTVLLWVCAQLGSFIYLGALFITKGFKDV